MRLFSLWSPLPSSHSVRLRQGSHGSCNAVQQLHIFQAQAPDHGNQELELYLYPDFFPQHWWLICDNQRLYTVSEYARKLSRNKTTLKQAASEAKMAAALKTLWIKHPDFAQAIMNTGTKKLIYYDYDYFWGRYRHPHLGWFGCNHLGESLMRLREEGSYWRTSSPEEIPLSLV